MRTVERINVALPVGSSGPARCLNCARDFEGELVKLPFAPAGFYFLLADQPPQIAVRGDVIESVIMDADVRQMRGHSFDCPAPAKLQKAFLAGRIELQQGRAKLKT